MHPILLEFGPLKLYTYGVLVALGFVAGLWVGGREAERTGVDPKHFQDLGLVILVGAVVGARALYVLLEWKQFSHRPLDVFALWKGGLVFYGGFAGAALAALVYVRRKRLPLWETADAIAPGLALGQAFGRLGCFFAGCCYGAPCDLPWAVIFRAQRSLAPVGVALHPTQLYEALASLALCGLLLFVVGPRRTRAGQSFGAYLVLYPVVRFGLEFLRADPRGALGALSTSQALGIPLVLVGLGVLAGRRGVSRKS